MIKITDTVKDMLTTILAEHPGKYLRVVVQGIG